LLDKLERLKVDKESSVVTVTLESTRVEISKMLRERDVLVKERNKILNNPFYFLFVKYRKKLRELDSQLDESALKIYSIESKQLLSQHELDELVKNAEIRLSKYT